MIIFFVNVRFFLKNISEKYQISITIELGLQSCNYHTLDKIERGHGLAEYIDACMRIKKYGFYLCTHVILNLPSDDLRDIIETSKIVSVLKNDLVKIHSLYVAKGTKMGEDYLAGKFSCLSLEEYGDWLKNCIGLLPENTVVHRITGDGAKKDLIAPLWSADKKRVLNYLNKTL